MVLHKKKNKPLSRLPFYVLLSARRATTLQKITVLLTQAKRDSQAGARKKCQTKGIYLVACLLPLITQHYCLYNPNLRRGELRNKHRKWENVEGRSGAAQGRLHYGSKKKTNYLAAEVNVK